MSSVPIRTLLIVDDEADLRDIIADEVSRAGFKVLVAANGTSALEALARESVHCVVCDMRMPRMSGVELLAKVRAGGNSVPFVFLTGQVTDEQILSATRLGAFDILAKPFDPDGLTTVIGRALDGEPANCVSLSNRTP